MSKSAFCSRPFKFVVVGENGSGKSTMIQRFVSGFREGEQGGDDYRQPTFSCDVHSVLVKSTVKRVCKNGSSVALSNEDIARRLWMKKFSKTASFPRSLELEPEDHQDIIWDEIFAYLQKPRRKKDSAESAQKSGPTINSTQSSPVRHVKDLLLACASETMRVSCEAKTTTAEIEIELWDIVGDKSLMWHRWYECTGADAVLLCVPLASILTFERSRIRADDETGNNNKVAGALETFMSDDILSNKTKKLDHTVPPVLLVGTKLDECDLVYGIDSEEEDIVDALGLSLAAEIGCCDFVSCSGTKGYGVTSVVEAAVAIALTSDGKYRSSIMMSGCESDTSDAETSLAREVAQPTYFKVHSFAKTSSPEMKVGTKTNEFELCSANRLPPRLFFPPPPDFSPPSTLPHSTSSSIERSGSSSSLDSLSDHVSNYDWTMKSPAAADNTPLPTINVQSPISSLCSASKRPTPIPRPRRLNSDSHRARPHGLSSFEEVKSPDDTVVPATPPVPKPRNILNSPRLQRRQKREKRRETIFIKFLQT